MSKRTLYTITAAPQLAVCVYGLVMIPGILATEEGAWLLNALAMPLILAPFLIGGIGDLLLVYPDPHPVPKKESRQRLLSGWIYCIEGTFALGAQIIAAVDPNIRRCSVTSFTVSSVIAFFGLYRIIWNKQPPWFKNEIAFAPYMKADSIGAQWYRRF